MAQMDTKAKPPAAEKKREKRTIADIRDSKKTGEKMVYMSVPDYTSAKWAEAAGVDVAVVGDSLAMIAHGHPSTIPATMDMMVMHAQAIAAGRPAPRARLHALPELQYGGPGAYKRHTLHAGRRLRAVNRKAESLRPISLRRWWMPEFRRRRISALRRTRSRCSAALKSRDAGGSRDEDPSGRARRSKMPAASCSNSRPCPPRSPNSFPSSSPFPPSASAPASAPTGKSCSVMICSAYSRLQAEIHQAICKLTEVAVTGITQYIKEVKDGTFPDDDHSYSVKEEEYEKFPQMVAKRRHV